MTRRRKRRPIEVEIDGFETTAGVDVAADLAERASLDQALRRLEPEWRAVVVLHYYLGLPMPEVAAILRIPTGTAKSRLNRSMALMRGVMTQDLDPAATPVRQGQTA